MLLYLIHGNDNSKYQYSINEVHANFDYGKFINKQNNELALKNVVKLIEDGTIREYNYTNYISPELYIKYKDKIKSAFEYRRDMIYNGNRNLEVIFIQGIPGSGKTTYAKHLAKQLGFSFYVSSSDNDLLDGYKSQDCIILDDLRGSSVKLTDLLKLLDNNTDSLTKSRFHNKVLTECKLIIITTVSSLDSFYKSVFESRNEPIAQLKRRITTHIAMDNSKVTVTQYNKATGNYETPCTFINPVFEILQSSTTMKETKILEEHKNFCEIWQASDGRWKTKLPDKTKKDGKRLIAKTSKASLEEMIIEWYKEKQHQEVALNTLKSLFPVWIDFKAKETSDGNAYSLEQYWIRYFANEDIINKNVSDLKTIDVKEWFLDKIEELKLSNRQFKDMKSVLNILLDYALEKELVQINVSRKVRGIPYKKFYEPKKKTTQEQIYINDEEAQIIKIALA